MTWFGPSGKAFAGPRAAKPQAERDDGARRGSVLLVVFVIIMLLTFGVYGFTQRMLAESAAAGAFGNAVTAQAMAESGIELAASYVGARTADPENPISLYHRPDVFAGLILRPSGSPRAVGRVSLVAPVEADPTAVRVRFGLIDESGKLNLNAIAAFKLEPVEETALLLNLPDMTPELADAILDYLDEDDTPRTLGAESEYYGSLSPATVAKNGAIGTLDELLAVRGVTPALLHGEDTNRNGLLDPNENDGLASMPPDDGDGVLRPGWEAFLTVHGRETNLRPDGTAKIFINEPLLTDLYDAVEEAVDEDAAIFITAYRMYGPNDVEEEDATAGSASGSSGGTTGGGSAGGGSSGSGSSGSGSSGSGAKSSGGSGSGTGANAGSSNGSSRGTGGAPASGGSGAASGLGGNMDKLAGTLGKMLSGGGNGGQVTRGGLDLSQGSKFEIDSLYELVDREVDAQIDGQAQTLISPWTSGSITTDFPALAAVLTSNEETVLKGRINVNEARLETLMGLPGMTQQVAAAIVNGRPQIGNSAADLTTRQTTAWLVAENLADLPTMRKVDRFLTGRGDVYRVQAVGYFDGGGPTARVEAILDGTTLPVKIVSFRDLGGLGRGYAPAQLVPGQN